MLEVSLNVLVFILGDEVSSRLLPTINRIEICLIRERLAQTPNH